MTEVARRADPVGAALRIFSELRKEIEEEAARQGRTPEDRERRARDMGSELRARAREAPEMIEDFGLVPTLSFFFSKRDSPGYGLMLKAVLEYLRELGLVAQSGDVSSMDVGGMIEVLQSLHGRSRAVVPLLRPFLVQFKRLCEATWEARER